MAMSLNDRVMVVTGGASGIGLEVVKLAVAAGARVAIADLATDAGVALADELGADTAMFVKTDVANADSVEALIGQTIERWGRLDYAFNNAGVADQGRYTADASEDDWTRVIDINLKGVWLCMRQEIRAMLTNGGGAIVNTASVAGLVGWRGSAAYAASKHGVIGLTKTVALEYANKGLRVNAVCPGVIDTPMGAPATQSTGAVHDTLLARHPAGRFGQPSEVAKAVLWLLSDEASFTTGHSLTVDGGYVVR